MPIFEHNFFGNKVYVTLLHLVPKTTCLSDNHCEQKTLFMFGTVTGVSLRSEFESMCRVPYSLLRREVKNLLPPNRLIPISRDVRQSAKFTKTEQIRKTDSVPVLIWFNLQGQPFGYPFKFNASYSTWWSRTIKTHE